ncbi:MAG TPA: hypothetical protein VF137_07165 [Candidatus Dormibacteraeota bacterium]
MRTPMDVFMGRVDGLEKREIARRTVPCYKWVVEPDGTKLEVCMLVDSRRLYRYPFEKERRIAGLRAKARYLRGEMEHLRLREFQPGYCRYVDHNPEDEKAS